MEKVIQLAPGERATICDGKIIIHSDEFSIGDTITDGEVVITLCGKTVSNYRSDYYYDIESDSLMAGTKYFSSNREFRKVTNKKLLNKLRKAIDNSSHVLTVDGWLFGINRYKSTGCTGPMPLN